MQPSVILLAALVSIPAIRVGARALQDRRALGREKGEDEIRCLFVCQVHQCTQSNKHAAHSAFQKSLCWRQEQPPFRACGQSVSGSCSSWYTHLVVRILALLVVGTVDAGSHTCGDSTSRVRMNCAQNCNLKQS